MINKPLVIVDFSQNADLSSWYIVDDVVMGSQSEGHMTINENGNGSFYGQVSLANNGGFSSVRYRTGKLDVSGYSVCQLKIKGQGQQYQFRVKSDSQQRYSYLSHFETTGEWQTITIDLSEMYPSFRGRRLDLDNYAAVTLSEISILISNKVAEDFRLEIAKITLH